MVPRRALSLLAVVAVIGIAGCDSSTAPSATSSGSAQRSADSGQSGEPGAEPTSPVVGQLTGIWRRSPVVLDDGHIAIISDACAKAARESLGEAAANLPTAVVDAQGESFAVAILADDLDAVECLVKLDETGQTATVDSIDRLSPSATKAVDADKLSLASLTHESNDTRTVAIGRVGPDVTKVRAGFDDQTFVLAAREAGWWVMWWKGTVKAATFAGVDNRNIARSSLPSPAGEVEARIDPAPWWIDPGEPAPTARSTTIHALILEKACSSGKPPKGRVEGPTIELTAESAILTFATRRLPGPQDCVGNEPFPTTVDLGERLGNRKLLDGDFTPPRDATKPPD